MVNSAVSVNTEMNGKQFPAILTSDTAHVKQSIMYIVV